MRILRAGAATLAAATSFAVATAAHAEEAKPAESAAPFAWGDFTWMNGQSRQKTFPLEFSRRI